MRAAAHTSLIPRSRHWVTERAQQEGASPDVIPIIALLTSEAVGNAVQHGPTDGEVDISVRRRADVVRVSVRDESPRPPTLRSPAPADLGGRGVMLIDRLAARWGVERCSPAGKTVWFEVALEPRTRPAPDSGRRDSGRRSSGAAPGGESHRPPESDGRGPRHDGRQPGHRQPESHGHGSALGRRYRQVV